MSAVRSDLLTAGEAAAVLGVQPQTVWKAAKRGTIPCVRIIPRRLGYPRSEVLVYAEN